MVILMGILYYQKIRFLVLGLLLPRTGFWLAYQFQNSMAELLVSVFH